MTSLYPPLEPDWTSHIAVGDGHELYVETCGNPNGRPVVVVHGGPGGGCSPDMRRFFNPDIYRIVLFDQRGAGRSRPLGSTQHNTTADLVRDLEYLRQHLRIEHWLMFGGSWGTTLSLAYAMAHPSHCHALILRGIWLARPEDLTWQFESIRAVYPDHWAKFVDRLDTQERANVIEAYYQRLMDPDREVHMPAAREWHLYEKRCSTLLPFDERVTKPEAEMLALSRIEAHYYRHGTFLEGRPLLADAQMLHAVPGIIIHGRYDLLCPVEGAFALAAAWPLAELRIVPDGGHSASEPGIQKCLIDAADRYAAGPAWC